MIIRNELMDIQPGAWFLKAMHPVGAQNKSLISNTDWLMDSSIILLLVNVIQSTKVKMWADGTRWQQKKVKIVSMKILKSGS